MTEEQKSDLAALAAKAAEADKAAAATQISGAQQGGTDAQGKVADASLPMPGGLPQVSQEDPVVRFYHHIPGATFVEGHNKDSPLPQAVGEGQHIVHRFTGGFLDVNKHEQPNLYYELNKMSQQRGSGVTKENQTFVEDPSIKQASDENRANAQASVEKILGKKL